ncbi:hypothetical protein [Tenacibaculum finnmarkense]|uniref:Membrane-binding protein n=1 Tax=Tenacibaculum finnmarkense genomovar ulcerans TaxID=2781388 RepID=A0A2I2M8N8_9FLAO|nr:hypothetical protein [Tenacibaculum finnmarkense]ALU75700.1 hypothetical protein AUW17_10750 [Tenacibaculum dicentrarchi]MBE7644783.1 hypothetical protein [Tenacibaculum finnmarkense genomovar ulcerans]MBE7646951.1 hypothetical protein [Tenacibaculum finnmarkense genomovar ulcerans]MBE7686724.1 hypothetical protein [Tenacibaculum finnmarkense genomovar ulcerans]MBE7691739.1 hypothetical protein [Tenacibaculum finnmarkense genomovar finnmarkense]
MKKSTIIILLFLSLLSTAVSAQKTIWLDKNKQETVKGNHEYYSIQEFKGTLKTFYKTGQLLEQGKYNNNQKQGVWKTFYKNGKIKTKGKYRNNKKIGVWKTFYKNVY